MDIYIKRMEGSVVPDPIVVLLVYGVLIGVVPELPKWSVSPL